METDRPNRSGVQDQLRTLIRRVRTVAEGMSRESFNGRPAEGSWSVGECIDHLNEMARLYLPVFAEAIEDGRAQGLLEEPASQGRTLIGRVIVWSQEPPVRFKMKTWEIVQPSRELDPEEVVDEFEALHEELIVRINEAADLDWKKIRLRSVLDPRLKLSLGDWFHFLAAHGRRHAWQAEQAREAVLTTEPTG